MFTSSMICIASIPSTDIIVTKVETFPLVPLSTAEDRVINQSGP